MDRFEGAPKTKVRNLKLSSEQKAELADFICKEVETALTDRGALESKWEAWAKQVKSRLVPEDIGAKEAKIDVGLTGERINAVKSRVVNALFQQDRLFYVHPTEPRFTDISRGYDDLIDYEWNRFDAHGFVESWLDDGMAFSAGFVKVPYTEDVEYVKRFKEIPLDQPEQLGEADKTTYDGETFVEESTIRKRKVGAFPRIVHTGNMIFPLTSPSIERAEWIAERIYMTKPDVNRRVKEGLFDRDAAKRLGSPSGKQEQLMACEGEKYEPTSKQYEVLEVYLSREVKKGEGAREIIVWVERHSKTILRACYNFYESYFRPYVKWCYRQTEDQIYGTPATFVLEPLHRAYSASFRQELDAASLANGKILMMPIGSDMRRVTQKGIPSNVYAFETAASMDQIKDYALSQSVTTNPQLRQQLSMHADKLLGLSPGSFGLEQAQRPTVTGQVEHLEEGRQPLHSTLEGFRTAMARVCEMMLSRLRQFGPESIQLYLRREDTDPNTPEDQLWKTFQWPDEYFTESVIIRVKASSSKMNKNLRKQEAVAMLDRIPQVYGVLSQMLQQVNPQNPMAPVMLQLANGFQVVVDQFLTEFDVDKKNILNPPLMEMMNYGQMVAQNMEQMQSHIQGLTAQNQQLQFQLAQVSGQAPGGMAGGVPPHPPQGPPQPGVAPPAGQ